MDSKLWDNLSSVSIISNNENFRDYTHRMYTNVYSKSKEKQKGMY